MKRRLSDVAGAIASRLFLDAQLAPAVFRRPIRKIAIVFARLHFSLEGMP